MSVLTDILNSGVSHAPLVLGYVVPMVMRRGSAAIQIARSLRFRSAASANLTKTFAGGPTAATKYTISLWIKRSGLAAYQAIMSSYINGTNETRLWFDNSDRLEWYDYQGAVMKFQCVTTNVYRDPSAHLHIVCSCDTVAGTQKIEVNGVEVAYTTHTQLSGSASVLMLAAAAHQIGSVNSTQFFNGYISEMYVIDGQALTASSFAQTDAATGAWVPKAYTGTFGNNGFWLSFDNNSSVANLGLDDAGGARGAGAGSNDWTVNNCSVTAGVTNDSLTDTPTNYGTDAGAGGEVRANYCTLNPLDNSTGTLSNGNLELTSGSVGKACRSTIPVRTGKWYAEATVGAATGGGGTIGLCQAITPLSNAASGGLGDNATGYSYFSGGTKWNNNSSAATGTAYTTGDVIGLALDLDNGKLWWSKNGTWIESGNPATGANPQFSGLSSSVDWFICGDVYAPGKAQMNFGQRPFASAAPSGFKALCTQNLPTPTIAKPSNEFVGVTAAGASDAISTALAAARSGWSSYVDILKPYDAVGAWKWRFSHDSSNEYSVSTTATRAAVSAPSANNWVSYSIKVDGTAGIKAGAQAHTNGAGDTTITHNSGISARQLILLFPRAGGDVYAYHPDLTAGNLLKLNTTAAQAALTRIKTVTSNSFIIESAAPTDTYDYLVIPELSGFFALGFHTGNAAADGPFGWQGLRPLLGIMKNISTTGDWYSWDSKRETYNPEAAELLLNTTAAQGSTADVDFTASGYKIRATTAGYNGSTNKIVTAGFAEATFRSARAR